MNETKCSAKRFSLFSKQVESFADNTKQDLTIFSNITHPERHLLLIDEQHLRNLDLVFDQTAKAADGFGFRKDTFPRQLYGESLWVFGDDFQIEALSRSLYAIDVVDVCEVNHFG